MSTATDTGTGLDWVTFEEHDHTKSCDFRTDPCSRQATHAGYYRPVAGDCPHGRRVLYCLIHRDRILQKSKLNHGLFGCPICEPFCVNYLLRMEAL